MKRLQLKEMSPSVVFIKDIQIKPNAKSAAIDGLEFSEDDLRDAKVEGTGSGFIWDNYGHIVRFNSGYSFSIFMSIDLKLANEAISLSNSQ